MSDLTELYVIRPRWFKAFKWFNNFNVYQMDTGSLPDFLWERKLIVRFYKVRGHFQNAVATHFIVILLFTIMQLAVAYSLFVILFVKLFRDMYKRRITRTSIAAVGVLLKSSVIDRHTCFCRVFSLLWTRSWLDCYMLQDHRLGIITVICNQYICFGPAVIPTR